MYLFKQELLIFYNSHLILYACYYYIRLFYERRIFNDSKNYLSSFEKYCYFSFNNFSYSDN